eukprot:1156894-Pelagomonas_calceolata.AAC.2
MERVPRTNSRYLLRSRGGHGGSREHSAPATATPPIFKSNTAKTPGPRISWRHPSSSTTIYVAIFQGLSSSHPPYHSVRCGRGHLQPKHFGAPLRDCQDHGLDSHTAIKIALKLHAHSVQCAYKHVSTQHTLEKTSFNTQTRATANNPPGPDWFSFASLGEGDTRCLGPRHPLFLN